MRSMLTTVIASLGTPMILSGDEFGRTQNGNNNAYAQDNEISWIDWAVARSPEGEALTDFVARLIRLRNEHPVIRCKRFLYGDEIMPGLRDIDWFDENGATPSPEDWQDPERRAFVMRRAAQSPDGSVEIVALLLNASSSRLDFQLPKPGESWRLLIDSADPTRAEEALQGQVYHVAERSAVLLAATLEGHQ